MNPYCNADCASSHDVALIMAATSWRLCWHRRWYTFRMLSLHACSSRIESMSSRSLPQATTLGSWIIQRLPGVISSLSAAMASTVAAEAAVPETVIRTLPG